jgi:hypothetical protein
MFIPESNWHSLQCSKLLIKGFDDCQFHFANRDHQIYSTRFHIWFESNRIGIFKSLMIRQFADLSDLYFDPNRSWKICDRERLYYWWYWWSINSSFVIIFAFESSCDHEGSGSLCLRRCGSLSLISFESNSRWLELNQMNCIFITSIKWNSTNLDFLWSSRFGYWHSFSSIVFQANSSL